MSDLPGPVTSTAGFKATVCRPRAWQAVLRIIRDEKDPRAAAAATARERYRKAIHDMLTALSPRDFEQLVDLILGRSGWSRISTLGGNAEGIDEEVMNPAADEIAYVQVKSSATQKTLDDYVSRFSNSGGRYARMIFAVHTPRGPLAAPENLPIQLWQGDRIAELVVRLGLGEWVERKLV